MCASGRAIRANLPSIVFNYLTTESDRQDMRDAVRISREIAAQRPLGPYRGEELGPGPEVPRPRRQSSTRGFAKTRGERVSPLMHVFAMGPDGDPMRGD